MKKFGSVLLSVVLIFGCLSTAVFAADYSTPFEKGTLDSERFRIPSIITLNDGSVLATADARWNHGSDSPNNIDVMTAKSQNGLSGWTYTVVNHFDDYADGITSASSASFIDSAAVQSDSTGRIFLISDAFPSGGGYNTSANDTGFTSVNGVQCLKLALNGSSDFSYYVGSFDGNFAAIYSSAGKTDYTVDKEYNIYLNSEALTMEQLDADGAKTGVSINQNVFYENAQFHVVKTSYLWLRTSDDNGQTWSSPSLLNSFVKNSNEAFLGVCPGRGVVTTVDGHERIIFAVYGNSNKVEKSSVIYSDDNGATWQRGSNLKSKIALGKSSEAQIIKLPDGTLRLFARNSSQYVSYADSSDGGVTWSTLTADTSLSCTKNCMVSFINTDKTINGKSVVLASFADDGTTRANGVVMVGVVDDNNSIDWITTYHVNEGFYAYSCLTELADGTFGLLYEDEAAHINYMVLTVSDSGSVSEINNNNISFTENNSGWNAFIIMLRNFFVRLLKNLNIF